MPSTVITALVAMVVLYSILTQSRPKKRYPPGPKGFPIFGNIFDIPTVAAYKTFAKWGWDHYGDIIYLRVLQKSIIIINSYQVAHDILEQRGAIYSCRPRVPMGGEVIGWDWALPLLPYGETFKHSRKCFQSYFAKQALPDYYGLQKKQANRLINAVLDDSDLLRAHVHRVSAATVLSIAYGHDAKTHDDWMLKEVAEGTKTIEAAGALGAHIVDLLPFLRYIPDWMPGAGFKRLPPGTREALRKMRYAPYEYVRKQMGDGAAAECYVSRMLESTNYENEQAVIDTAASMYATIFDTTYTVLMTMILLLTKYPDVQAKLQDELDRVVGSGRLPDFGDFSSLPYFQCVLDETLRCSSTLPVGVPHRNTEDDVYNGMLIPKGSTILANIWAMLHDPSVYENPEDFNPDRFMPRSGRPPAPSARLALFGFGRRRCPGEDFAINMVSITIATLFHVFTFGPKMDKAGKAIPIDDVPIETTVRHPKPFVCHISPRGSTAVALIRAVSED